VEQAKDRKVLGKRKEGIDGKMEITTTLLQETEYRQTLVRVKVICYILILRSIDTNIF